MMVKAESELQKMLDKLKNSEEYSRIQYYQKPPQQRAAQDLRVLLVRRLEYQSSFLFFRCDREGFL